MDLSDSIAVPAASMELLGARIEAETGLSFSPRKWRELDSALHKMAEFAGFERHERCIAWLLEGAWSDAKTALCARFLTIGETYFFREPRALDLVCEYARERIGHDGAGHAPLRIWSAGCCTGEEPYSIAMMLRQQVPELARTKLTILATDINDVYLEFARAGIYRQWSFRRTPAPLQAAYFAAAGDKHFRIDQSIREQVRFERLNLATQSYPSAATRTEALDVIFCRNVLMYFSRRGMKEVIGRLRACLVDGGWLVVNPSEASSELFDGFTPTYFPDAVYFRKTDARQAGPIERRRPAPARPQPARSDERAAPRWPIARERRRAATPEPGAHALEHARSLARAGQPQAALHCLQRAIEAAPLDAELYQASVLIALDHGDHGLAQRHLKGLLYLQPESILGHYLGAMVDIAQGRRGDAVRHLKTCREMLAAAGDDDIIVGTDGWQCASLRESVALWLEQAA